jgi:predicted ATPase/Tfp pilus assembly protein PilF
MGLVFQPTRPQRQQLFDALRGKQVLLVLDNFEHLLNPQGTTLELTLLIDLLRQLPQLKLLVTSRERLNLRDEWIVALVGLTPESARLLFGQLARQVRGEPLAQADEECVARICQLVSGTPLALELAASWLRTLPCDAVAREIEQSLDFLTTNLRDVPERHRSLRAVFEQSWRMLSPVEREVFQRLSILSSAFTREAAQTIADATLSTLAALVDKSLIRLRADGRYELQELLRQYGAALLAENPVQEARTRERHSAYYYARLQQCERELRGARQQQAIEEIEGEQHELRAAWHWAVQHRQVERLAQGIECLGLFVDLRGGYDVGRFIFGRTIELLANPSTPFEVQTLVRLLCWQSHFLRELGESDLARQAVARAATLLHDPRLHGQDTQREAAHLCYRQARIAVSSDRDRAYQLMQESVTRFRTVEDRWWIAHTLGWLAEIDYERGFYARAQHLCAESLELWRALGTSAGIATALTLLGWIALSRGEFVDALAHQTEALHCFRALGMPALVSSALRNLGAAQLFAGKFAEAQTSLAESIRLNTQLGNRSATVFPLILQGALLLQLGDYTTASDWLRQSLSLAHECKDDPGIAHARHWLGHCAIALNQLDTAQQLLQTSAETFRALHQRDQVSATLATLALVAQRAGDPQRANRHFADALRLAAEVRAITPLFVLAPLAITLGREADYVEQLGDHPRHILNLPFVRESHWARAVYPQLLPD